MNRMDEIKEKIEALERELADARDAAVDEAINDIKHFATHMKEKYSLEIFEFNIEFGFDENNVHGINSDEVFEER